MKQQIIDNAQIVAESEGFSSVEALIMSTAETYNRFVASGDTSSFKKGLGVFFYHFIEWLRENGLTGDSEKYNDLVKYHEVGAYGLESYELMLEGLYHLVGGIDVDISEDPKVNLYNNQIIINGEEILAYTLIGKEV